MRAPRIHVRAVLATALMLSIGGLVAMPVSPASAAPKLAKAPQVDPGWPVAGEVITLSGTIGKSVKRVVKLQTWSGGSWRVAAKKTVKKKGRYSFSINQASQSARYRVAAPKKRVGKLTWPRKLSKVRVVSLQSQSTVLSTVRSVKAGTLARLTMWLSPVRNGRPVAVQRYDGATWQTVATVAENSIGQAVYDYPANEIGDYDFRAVQLAFNGAPESAGAAVELAVLPADPVQVVAHRGASSNNPENTKSAIRNAVKLGADYLELDLQRTAPDYPDPDGADGPESEGPRHWILLHDRTLARTTNVAAVFGAARAADPVSTFTLAEIKQLDAGSWKGTKFACTQTKWTGNCRIPTLEEVIGAPGTLLPNGETLAAEDAAVYDAEQENSRAVKLVLEHKVYDTAGDAAEMQDLYDRVAELQPGWIHPDDHDDKVVFMSFYYANEFEQFATAPLASEGAELAAIVDDTTADTVPSWPVNQVHIRNDLVSPAAVQPWRDHGVTQIAAWTVNSADAMLRVATTGATMVTTDDIELARSTLLR
ncbi:glycerophosphodiester phosphodiesterase [Nocardioides sp.]|uniref:glycerophosphodiester phosphodiesterase n=1 Tax=Nocardioides sp. TaxID=35761 RepID=UPI0039E69759